MQSTRSRKFLFLTLTLAVILACSPFAAPTPQPAATLNALYTAAAQTLSGMSTQAVATQFSPTPTLSLSVPTASPVVFETYTPVPPLSPVPVSRCDAAAFVTDVTYPDGSNVTLGGTFTKIWRLKNVGTCTWTTSYALVYMNGERFAGPAAVGMPTNVGPGQTVDLAVNLTAPNASGHYRGYWKLRNASNVVFGIGTGADSNFYVDINVTGYNVTGYDFVANACDGARWQNGSGDLPCPGTDGDNQGFILVLDSPKMEDGRSQGKGLLTFPRQTRDGVISGKFEGLKIHSGDRFQTQVGCMYQANDCDMVFRLQYQIGNGSVRTLGQWREVYEGQFYPINIDLSPLSGEKVKFILSVLANGSAHEDYALWISPRITSYSSQPPTAIPTVTATPTSTATPMAPTVTTQAVTNITTTTATGNGNITALGIPNPTQHGVVWSTSANPTTADNKTTDGPISATGTFTSSMTGLTPGTLYHVRAYATNTVGTAYGEDVTFVAYQMPAVTTSAVTDIMSTTATGNGNVTVLGVPNPTQRGVVWSTSANPTTADNKTADGPVGATGAFTSSMTGLTPGTLYHVRAYAVSAAGTVYGEDVTFTTTGP